MAKPNLKMKAPARPAITPAVVIPGGAKLEPAAQNAAISTAFKRSAQKIATQPQRAKHAPLTTEREVSPNIFARVENGELIITVPYAEALKLNESDNGHTVLASCGGRFGALDLDHEGLRLSFYLAKGTAPKKAAKN
jgi:hypothetical protein